jgi:hypothetical protein
MKAKIFFLLAANVLAVLSALFAQDVKVEHGPDFPVTPGFEINRLIDGGQKSLFTLRTSSRGMFYYFDKYDKKTLARDYTAEIKIGQDKIQLEDVFFVNGKVYVFTSGKNDSSQQALTCSVIMPNGKSLGPEKEIFAFPFVAGEPVEFNVSMNPSGTRFLADCVYRKAGASNIQVEALVLNEQALYAEWGKSDLALLSLKPDFRFSFSLPAQQSIAGEYVFDRLLGDDEKIYFAYPEEEQGAATLKIAMMPYVAASGRSPQDHPLAMTLPFTEIYSISDARFFPFETGEIFICGLLRDAVKQPGRDFRTTGIFSVSMDQHFKFKNQSLKLIDAETLATLESDSLGWDEFKYKVDYAFQTRTNAYVVAQQYRVRRITSRPDTGLAGRWEYEYRNVIVARQTIGGEFEWLTNIPMLNSVLVPHRQFISQHFAGASDGTVTIFINDMQGANEAKRKRFQAGEKDSGTRVGGGVLNYFSLSSSSGAIMNRGVVEDADYFFDPGGDQAIALHGKANELYTCQQRGDKGRIIRMTIEDSVKRK